VTEFGAPTCTHAADGRPQLPVHEAYLLKCFTQKGHTISIKSGKQGATNNKLTTNLTVALVHQIKFQQTKHCSGLMWRTEGECMHEHKLGNLKSTKAIGKTLPAILPASERRRFQHTCSSTNIQVSCTMAAIRLLARLSNTAASNTTLARVRVRQCRFIVASKASLLVTLVSCRRYLVV
jgi:hypothetical protein